MSKRKKLLVMAGGTGGHIFPALAVALDLQQQGWEVRWLGTKDRMEAELVPKYGIAIDFINVSGIRSKGIKRLLSAPFMILRAIFQARKIIKAYKPYVVLGMGGYVSGPGGVAAKLSGIPLVIHEQNAVAGMTNVLLAKIATKVIQAFPTAFKKQEVVGNPVRKDILELQSPTERYTQRSGALRLLIIGGSQGAKVLNILIPEVALKLANKNVNLNIHHQVGKGLSNTIKELYADMPNVEVFEFMDDIAKEYAWADLVICRSGALTVSEIAAAGLPAIFVPFRHKDQQQYLNAKYLADVGAAFIIKQADLNPDRIADKLAKLDREQLLKIAMKAQAMSKPYATEKVAQIIIDLAK